MPIIDTQLQADAKRASRAIGAMFFTIFGGAWIGLWSAQTFPDNVIYLALVAVCTLAIFMFVINQYRRYKSALEIEKDDPIKKKNARLFNLINAGQWIVIVVGINVLNNIGYSHWAIPFGMFIIGLHFIPLAAIFANPPHYITGAAMMLVALIYPLVLQGGPDNPFGCLAAGVILWASALWAVIPKRVKN